MTRNRVEVGEAEVMATTDMAILVWIEDFDEEQWVPRSQLHDDCELEQEGDQGLLVVKRFIADKYGWKED